MRASMLRRPYAAVRDTATCVDVTCWSNTACIAHRILLKKHIGKCHLHTILMHPGTPQRKTSSVKHDKPAQVLRSPTTFLPRGATLLLSVHPHFTHVEHRSWRASSEPLTSSVWASQQLESPNLSRDFRSPSSETRHCACDPWRVSSYQTAQPRES